MYNKAASKSKRYLTEDIVLVTRIFSGYSTLRNVGRPGFNGSRLLDRRCWLNGSYRPILHNPQQVPQQDCYCHLANGGNIDGSSLLDLRAKVLPMSGSASWLEEGSCTHFLA